MGPRVVSLRSYVVVAMGVLLSYSSRKYLLWKFLPCRYSRSSQLDSSFTSILLIRVIFLVIYYLVFSMESLVLFRGRVSRLWNNWKSREISSFFGSQNSITFPYLFLNEMFLIISVKFDVVSPIFWDKLDWLDFNNSEYSFICSRCSLETL